MNKPDRTILRDAFNRFLLGRGLNRTERLFVPRGFIYTAKAPSTGKTLLAKLVKPR